MKKTKRFLTITSAMAVLFAIAVVVSAWTPVEPPPYVLEFARSEQGVLPVLVNGNDPGSLPGLEKFKQDYNKDGFVLNGEERPVQFDFYPDPEDATVKLSIWLDDTNGFIQLARWEATNMSVEHMITKGGPDFFVYSYDGDTMEDANLFNPRVGNDYENISGLSHFSVFWTTPTEETTTEETTTEETTTEETTTEETTTEETTTEGTTTEEETLPTLAEEETIPQAEETTTETMPETTATLQEEEIPQTGQSGGTMVIGATLLALASALGLILHRSRKRVPVEIDRK